MAKESGITTRKKEVEQALHAQSDQIDRRLAALQEEVASIGPAVKRALFAHPLVSVGGALLAGLAVGLLFGGRRRPAEAFGTAARHRALVEQYIEAVIDEARHRVVGGQEAGQAVRAALEDRVPLIVYEAAEAPRRGVLRQALSIVATTALGLGVRTGMKYLVGGIDLPGILDEEGDADAAPGETEVAFPEATDA